MQVHCRQNRLAARGVATEIELEFALAQELNYTNLRGGLPIVIEGKCIGAIGVGSGTGDQDVEVAKAGLAEFLNSHPLLVAKRLGGVARA